MYKVCIPSYNRHTSIYKKTLKMLEKYRVPKDIIYIFVADLLEYHYYRNELGDSYNIIVGVKGMMNIRNFITGYFDEGEHLVMIDDDIADITHFEKYYESLDSFITSSFNLCIENNCKLWGIYPVDNPYFMKPRIVFGLTYVCGGLYGVINNKKLLVTMNDKEDYQRSLQYYIDDGKVMRYECIGIKTKGYTGIGGMNHPEDRSYEIILESALKLTEAYPSLSKLNLTKKSGKPEVKLSRKIVKVIELEYYS